MERNIYLVSLNFTITEYKHYGVLQLTLFFSLLITILLQVIRPEEKTV